MSAHFVPDNEDDPMSTVEGVLIRAENVDTLTKWLDDLNIDLVQMPAQPGDDPGDVRVVGEPRR